MSIWMIYLNRQKFVMCVSNFLWLVLPDIEERDDSYGYRIISMALYQMMGWIKESAGAICLKRWFQSLDKAFEGISNILGV